MGKSREQIVGKLMDDNEKLQYDSRDPQRIYDASEKVTQSFVYLLEAAAAFKTETQSEVNEDSADTMKQLRMQLAYAYADALVQLHRLGATFRFSNEPFDRMIEYLKGPEEGRVVMSGL